LNERGITIDADLEKKNFKFARVTLAEIWSQIIIDKFPTVAEYIESTNPSFSVVTGRFLPPPLPITQASVGLKIPERTIDGTSHNFFIGVRICAVQYEIHTKMTIKVM